MELLKRAHPNTRVAAKVPCQCILPRWQRTLQALLQCLQRALKTRHKRLCFAQASWRSLQAAGFCNWVSHKLQAVFWWPLLTSKGSVHTVMWQWRLTMAFCAQVVYNEYIADRHHVHMNSTKWLTLSEFVQHLGETGELLPTPLWMALDCPAGEAAMVPATSVPAAQTESWRLHTFLMPSWLRRSPSAVPAQS